MKTMNGLMESNKQALKKAIEEGRAPEDYENRKITFGPGSSLSLEDDNQGLPSFQDPDCLKKTINDDQGLKYEKKLTKKN